VSCKRCEADPRPAHFGSNRGCAFKHDGSFTPKNWNCATINALLEYQQGDEHYGQDEHLEVVSVLTHSGSESNGWIVTTRYKHRGQTASAVHVTQDGYFPVTLQLIEEVLQAYAEARAFDAVARVAATGHKPSTRDPASSSLNLSGQEPERHE